MDAYNNLYNRALRAIAQRPLDKVVERTRAIVGPPLANLEGEARDGLAALKQGTRPTSPQVAALQAIVRSMRPSVLSRDGRVDPLPAEAQLVFAEWPHFSNMIAPHLYTVGRVDRKSAGPLPAEPFGSGFLIAPDLFLTNHHVVTLLSNGTDVVNEGEAEIRFVQEYNSAREEDPVPVIEVQQFHEDEDAAVLRLAYSKSLKERQPLGWSNSPLNESDEIAVIGYPFPDTTRNPLFVDQIFGNKIGVKRLAPGELIGTRKGSVFHDCSTLGGNSGSPLLNMRTGSVVGLHRDGYFLARNEAVSAGALQDFVSSYGGVIWHSGH